MCVSNDRFEEMSTPIYFAEDTDSSMQLWRVYCVAIGFLDLVMWIWYLEGLNYMSHLWLQRSRLSRSFGGISDWDYKEQCHLERVSLWIWHS